MDLGQPLVQPSDRRLFLPVGDAEIKRVRREGAVIEKRWQDVAPQRVEMAVANDADNPEIRFLAHVRQVDGHPDRVLESHRALGLLVDHDLAGGSPLEPSPVDQLGLEDLVKSLVGRNDVEGGAFVRRFAGPFYLGAQIGRCRALFGGEIGICY